MNYTERMQRRAALTLNLTDKVQTIRLVGKPKTFPGHWFRLKRDGRSVIIYRQCAGDPCPYCGLTDSSPLIRVACNVEIGSRLLIQSIGLAAWLRLDPILRPLGILDVTKRVFDMAATAALFDPEHGNRSHDLHARKQKLHFDGFIPPNPPSPFVFRRKGALLEEPARTDLHDLDVLFAPMDYDVAAADAKAIKPILDQ
mgnify:CR=1 FL=1